ncbi:hypothetical protein F5I97DRAFT_1792621, partial [Phlebopus sp. FC_14]
KGKRKRPKERLKAKTKANRANTDSDGSGSDEDSDTMKSEVAQHARTNKSRNHAERVFVTKGLMKRAQLYACVANSASKSSKDILIDSGCSRHMTPHRSWFVKSTYQPLRKPIPIHLGDDLTIKAVGVGSIECIQLVNGERRHLIIKDVLHAP